MGRECVRRVELGLFVEQTIWGKLKGCEGWTIWRSRGRVFWQREKTTQWSKVRESSVCSRRLGCLEWNKWAAEAVKEWAEARHAGGGLHFCKEVRFFFFPWQEAIGRSWGREWHHLIYIFESSLYCSVEKIVGRQEKPEDRLGHWRNPSKRWRCW